MEKYDLTPELAKYLDKHLLLPLLFFIERKKLYGEKALFRSQLELLAHTNLLDLAADVHKKLNDTETVPEDMIKRREDIMTKIQELENGCNALLELIDNAELRDELEKEDLFTFQNLEHHYKITRDIAETLYKLAKFQFECGNYTFALSGLKYYGLLMKEMDIGVERMLSVLWGMLASAILLEDWTRALKELVAISDLILTDKLSDPKLIITNRVWMLHWSLFIFFNHENSRTALLDIYFNEKNLSAIELEAPHLLRYLTAAVMIEGSSRKLDTLANILSEYTYSYSDPLTKFVVALYVNCDFDLCKVAVRECEEVYATDFFLTNLKDNLRSFSRSELFNIFCKVHRKFSLTTLADLLGLEHSKIERYVLEELKNADLDAKILFETEELLIEPENGASVYEEIVKSLKLTNPKQKNQK